MTFRVVVTVAAAGIAGVAAGGTLEAVKQLPPEGQHAAADFLWANVPERGRRSIPGRQFRCAGDMRRELQRIRLSTRMRKQSFG